MLHAHLLQPVHFINPSYAPVLSSKEGETENEVTFWRLTNTHLTVIWFVNSIFHFLF